MKPLELGPFRCGFKELRVRLLPKQVGGSFSYPPCQIEVGLDHLHWEDVLSTLVHELFEYSLSQMGRRYEATSKTSGDHGDYLFSHTHAELSQACQEVAEVLAECLPAVRKGWKRSRK